MRFSRPHFLSACLAIAAANLTLFVAAPTLVFASTEGAVSGTIKDEQGNPISGVRVRLESLEGGQAKETLSNEDGGYQFFPVLLGDYEIVTTESGRMPTRYGVHVSSGGNVRAEVTLAPEAPTNPEMVVKVSSKKRLVHTSASASSTEISKADIKKLPQGTEISLPRLIATTTPGVSAGAFGQMFFRGNHSSIQYQIDGIQLPDSLSGTFGQAFSPRNIDHMEVITGGIPAEYGLRLGAVINIITQSGHEEPSGEVELNYGTYNSISPHLIYGGSNSAGDLKYYLSASYNQTERGLDSPQPFSVDNQFQGGREAVHNFSSGNSEFLRLDWLADNQNKLVFSAYHATQSFQIPNFPASIPSTDAFFSQDYTDQFGNQGEREEQHGNHVHPAQALFNYTPPDTDDVQTETNFYGQVAWKHTFSERSFFQLSPYYKYALVVVKNDLNNDLYSRINGMPGATPNSFSQNRHVNNLGLKGDYSTRPVDSHLIKTGFQVQGGRSDGWISIQRRPDRAPHTNSDSNIGYFESVYVQDDITLAKPLVLNVGLRYDATQFIFSGAAPVDGMLQPRVGLNYMVTDATKLHAFYGKLFQPAPVESLRTTFGAFNHDGGFEPYDIKAEKDDYFEVGVAHQLLEKQVVSLNTYYKVGENIQDASRLLRTPLSQTFNFTKGYGYGVELAFKGQITQDWSDFANYSYTVARAGEGISGGIWASDHPATQEYQTLDHVQNHTANAGITYSKNNYWWTTQGQYGSGLRTGPDNTVQLPGHFTMDTTVGYDFKGTTWLSQSKVSFDVLNIFDNTYPINIGNGYNSSSYAAGRVFWLRFTKSI